MPRAAGLVLVLGSALSPVAGLAQVVVNEVVTDPQRDWNDAEGGTPFDAAPGGGTLSSDDEWIELANVSGQVVDLTGWSLALQDGASTVELLGVGSATLVFSAGGSLSSFQAGEYLVVGNPAGAMDNTILVQLSDPNAVVDAVALGPGGAPDGNASSIADEAVARFPDAADTGNDATDFTKRPATIGGTNGEDEWFFADGFESGTTSAWSWTHPAS